MDQQADMRHHRLASRTAADLGDPPGISRLLDAVRCQDGLVRAFFGSGTLAGALAATAPDGCAQPVELRPVSGAVMGVFSGDGPVLLAGGAPLALTPDEAEPSFLAGRNCLLAFRVEESPMQVAEWLVYHGLHHGAQGAVIVNRMPGSFPGDLAAQIADTSLRVVVLDCPLPIGKPGVAPENHIYLAPDAPGKARMAVPEADPWRSPPGEPLIHEICKWRYLSQARAVLNLDVTDILTPLAPNEVPAFDHCRTSKTGVILLLGRHIYPWRVRPAQGGARIGDHVCRPFDKGDEIARWGAAPDRAGLRNTWRGVRVSYASPDRSVSARFDRAMAIRVPGATPSELAPKAALVEDPALVAMSQDLLGWNPVRPPRSSPRKADGANQGRVAIVTTMRNEAPFILEWIAWHRAIGMDDFLVYTNDCTDGTDSLLALLQDKGLVQHRDNPFRSMDLTPQHGALQAAEDEPVMRDCGWGLCMDVDEFINIKLGDGRLPTLFAAMEGAMPGANMIAMTWRLFGNGDIDAFADSSVIEQFTRCAPERIRKPHQAWGFKTLFRNIDLYRKLGVHRPKGLNPDQWTRIRWLTGGGQPMPRAMFRNGWRSTSDTYGYDWVQLNHYAVRSAESFLVKRDRGRVNHVERDQGLAYWFRMNHNIDEDRSIQSRLPLLRAEMDRLLADPDIAAAHAQAVASHRARIAVLRADPVQSAFHAELTGARMQKLCRLQRHFGSGVFHAGPQVIPDDLLDRVLPDDFFFTVGDDTDADEAT
ncbi:MAG: glycosyltransferase family 2 protein [Gemmobacter sp.]